MLSSPVVRATAENAAEQLIVGQRRQRCELELGVEQVPVKSFTTFPILSGRKTVRWALSAAESVAPNEHTESALIKRPAKRSSFFASVSRAIASRRSRQRDRFAKKQKDNKLNDEYESEFKKLILSI